MTNIIKYPKLIPDRPNGEDVFEGQSQTHLAETICSYITSNDNANIAEDVRMPKIIGLEGSWGSGKSNVVSKVKQSLYNEGYYTFTYDAWGHQEDLQRRSILETLTNTLIEDNVLHGDVDIKMRNGKIHRADWKDQLSLLLSNKTTVVTKSQPKLSSSAVVGILLVGLFAVLTIIAGQFLGDEVYGIYLGWIVLIECLPIIIGVFMSIGFRLYDHNWDRVITLLTQKEDNTIDEQYTSSEEPSIAEFKNWMHAISNHLGNTKKNGTKKIIIVFDNMDRLPSAKVMQLWSVIYTFFAGSDFANIWTIIPYDYKHLCNAVNDGSEEANDDKFKRFVDKTFPIVYTVPQPVITDYTKLFNKYFEDAFGKNEHDQNHICQVFMRIHVNPNPRTVIAFVNELVAIRLQWPDKEYRLQNLALFVLKKDAILYNGDSVDSNLLSDGLLEDVASFYPSIDEVRTQMCQFAYGLTDKSLAEQLPLRRLLLESIKLGNPISTYINKPNFIDVLQDILSKDVTVQTLDNAVKSLDTLDLGQLSEEASDIIQKKWDMLANLKSRASYSTIKFDETLHTIIQHAIPKRIKGMCVSFVSKIQKCKFENGAEYYNALSALEKSLEVSGKNIPLKDILNPMLLSPQNFIEFVLAAGNSFEKYQVKTDNNKLNIHVFSSIENEGNGVDEFMSIIKDVTDYDFTILKTKVAEFVAHDKATKEPTVAAYINRILDDGDGVLSSRYSNSFVNQTVSNLNSLSVEDKNQRGVEDIYAMYMADGNDIPNIDESIIPRIAECFEKYMEYSSLLQQTGSQNSAYRLLNVYVIKNKLGNEFDWKYAAQHIETLHAELGLDYSDIFSHFNHWKADWSANDESNYQDYCRQGLFNEYKKNAGMFTDSLIKLSVKVMTDKPQGFLYSLNSTPNSYWSQFIITYLGTDYIPSFTENLYEDFSSLLDRVINANRVEYPDLLDKLLSSPKEMSKMTLFLHNKLNENFSKRTYSIDVFKVFGGLLPSLRSNMDENTARGLIEYLIKPIVTNADCADIIVENHQFYLGILSYNKTMSKDILEKMKSDDNVKAIYSSIEAEIDKLLASKDDEN